MLQQHTRVEDSLVIFCMRFLLVLFAFFCFLTSSYGQVKKVVDNFKTQIVLIDSLLDNSDYDSALSIANSLLRSTRMSQEERIEVLLSKQYSFYYLGQYDSLRAGLDQLKGKIDASNPGYLHVLALLDGEEGNYSAAISKLLDASKLLEDEKSRLKLMSVYNSLGYNYKALNELDAAKEYYLKARAIAKQVGRKIPLAMVDNNLGSLFRMLNQLDSALIYYKEATQLLTGTGNRYFIAQNLTNLGNLYEQLKEYQQAKKYFEQCLALSESADIQYGILISKLNLGNIYRLTQEFDQSENYLQQALSMALEMGLKREQSHAIEHLSWLSRDLKDYKSAYEFLEKHYGIKDSLAGESVKKQAIELKERYESEKKENEIISLSSQKLYQQLVIALLGIGFLMLFLLAQWWRGRNKLLEKEMEKDLLREKLLKQDIANKEKELLSQANQLLKVYQKLEDTEIRLSEFYKQESIAESKLSTLADTLVLNPLKDLINDFDKKIISENEGFFRVLLENYPDLSLAELKLCAFMKLNLSNKELSQILNKSVRTIETYRTTIRKKMKLNINENLVLHLLTLMPTN